MAFTFANRGLYTLLNVAISGTTDLRMAVFKGTPPAAGTIQDYNVLSDVTGSYTEAAASGYARADLANVALAENDTPNNVTLTADAPTWTSVAAGETWTFVAYYVYNAVDSSAALIGIDDPAADQVTNGGNIVGPALSITVAGA